MWCSAPTGRNFGAGFSGGNTYVLDLDMKKVNPGAIKSGALLFKSLDAETSKLVKAAGANVLVAGSYVYGAEDTAAAIASLK